MSIWPSTSPWATGPPGYLNTRRCRCLRRGHFRLLQRIHQPSGGQLTASLARLPEADRQALRNPHPEVLQILDPRPLLDEAARYRTGGLLVCETLAAGLLHGRQLWFGTGRNIGDRLATIADDLAITIHLAEPT